MLPLVSECTLTPQMLLPVHRHRGLHLLMGQVKGKVSQRDAAEYMRSLEQAIWLETLGGRSAYMSLLRSMAFNLRQNGQHLMETHSPGALLQLDHVVPRGVERQRRRPSSTPGGGGGGRPARMGMAAERDP